MALCSNVDRKLDTKVCKSLPSRKFSVTIKSYEPFLCGVKNNMNSLRVLLVMHMNEKMFIVCEET
jgi:hypothetical protein